MESTASRKTLIEHLRYIQKTKGVRGLYSGIIFEYYKVRIVLMPYYTRIRVRGGRARANATLEPKT